MFWLEEIIQTVRRIGYDFEILEVLILTIISIMELNPDI